MAGLQRVVCSVQTYSRDSRCSGYASGSQYTTILNVSGILICQIFAGYIDRIQARVLNLFRKQLYNNFKLKFKKIRYDRMCIWSETWILFLALSNIHFLWDFGKSLRNNSPPTYCLAHDPSICSNITNATHFSTLHTRHQCYQTNLRNHVSTPFTQACSSGHLSKHTTHSSHVNTLPIPPTLACHPCKDTTHATHAITLPMQARYPRHPR